MFTTKKIAAVSVINDLVTDNRVNKTCLVLKECGYDVVLIGRKLPASLDLPAWPYRAVRMNLLFKSGPLFYLFFNLRLFLSLLFKKSDLLYSNDLDTLLPNFLVSRLKRIPLIYDSHELFCEVPELQNSKLKRKIWLSIESWIVPKLKMCITVNDSIARIFSEKYKVPFTAIRNISDYPNDFVAKSREELKLPLDKKIILLQGAGINVDRGAEELIDAMEYIDQAILIIIGSGDVWENLKEKIVVQNLSHKIKLIYKIPKTGLMHYTHNADLGLSIDKNTNLNYYYSLPNKVFDYINAGVPLLASHLPEIEKIIKEYNVGDFITDHLPLNIAAKINELLSSHKLITYKENCLKAKSELNWTSEKLKLIKLIEKAGS
ncbi:glycosyltransferase [Aurantibacillus circumpalustris]|uniref:glycosyltransferase n=1 Tax=Aurantibacillus circumpalustris TaxID=3036359 RepID=UPI00295B0F9D|nr:glycosyltransferase [Aurantibacillus circumpalustris]